MYNYDLQKNLEAETFDYALDIVNAILLNENWKKDKDVLFQKYYIDNTDDGKILVILSEPYKIYPLRAKKRNDREKYSLENAIKEILINLGLRFSHDEDEDVNILSVDKKDYKRVLQNYYGVLQGSKHVSSISVERLDTLLYEICEVFMNKRNWTELKNGLSYLNYDYKYEGGKLLIYVNNNVVRDIHMTIDEYYKVKSCLESELLKYKITMYGNGSSNKYLSSYDLNRSIRLFYFKDESILKRNYC